DLDEDESAEDEDDEMDEDTDDDMEDEDDKDEDGDLEKTLEDDKELKGDVDTKKETDESAEEDKEKILDKLDEVKQTPKAPAQLPKQEPITEPAEQQQPIQQEQQPMPAEDVQTEEVQPPQQVQPPKKEAAVQPPQQPQPSLPLKQPAQQPKATPQPKEEPKTVSAHIKPLEESDVKPIDILNISNEEFYKSIGININEEFIAELSAVDKVKIKKKKHLKTGVPGFDELVDKGIPQGTSILVSGGPGSGKTTFCIQQLGWAAERGEKCLFISLEEKEERLIEHMKGFGLNPEKYIKNETLKIKKLDSFKLSRAVEALLAHARGELMIDVAPVLDIIPENYKPKRVVLDSLSSISAAFAGKPEEYRVYVEQLFNIFNMLGVTSFIITEIQGVETRGHGGIEEFLADGVINFYNIKKGALRQPALEILKMRGVNHKRKIVPFNYAPGLGIEVYPLEEVFHGDE
ncbi:Flp pilus assembly complex ATPase component TadA, partial [Candidatus Woesearchaeota archaeon]|nr:Flp pilus assembly complex ATPase component TadA [Candidatus Woesearchaeota archaeon]